MKKLPLLLLIFSLLTGCVNASTATQDRASAPGAPTPTPLPTAIAPDKPQYTLQRGEVVRELEFRAQIAPVQQEELMFRTDGYVHAVYFKRGDTVQAGEVIADLEGSADLARRFALQAIQVERAEIRLENAQRALEDYTANAAAAEIQRAAEQSRRENEVRLAEMSLADAERRYAAGSAEVERANIQLENAQQALESYLSSLPTPAQLENEDERQQSEVRLAELGLEEARLNLEDLQEAIDKARIVAPFTGQILALSLSAGRGANAYTPVVTIGDVSALEASAEVPVADRQFLSAGLAVNISPYNKPGESITGVIYALPANNTSGNATSQEQAVRITLDANAASAFGLGDTVRVRVAIEQSVDTLWLPPQAIRSFAGRTFVVVLDASGQRSVDVRLGVVGETRVEILPVEGQESLLEGQTILAP